MTKLTKRFEDALIYATHVHAAQTRKGTEIPYLSHLLAVAALVLEGGGDEDEAIAALLHDTAEDQGGRARLEDVRSRFGDRVADIVCGCTDTFEDPKPEWLERKRTYLSSLPAAPASVRRVAAADKLHNARCILADFRVVVIGCGSDSTQTRSNNSATIDASWRHLRRLEVARLSRSWIGLFPHLKRFCKVA